MHHPRSVLTGVVALAALVSVAPASATPLTDARADGCATSMTFLVWPHGHPAIPAIGFGDMTTPHMEIYKGGGGAYANARFLAWAAGGATPEPSPSTTPACLSFASVPKSPKPIGTMSVLARTAAITCTFPGSGSIDIERTSGGSHRYRIRILLSGGRLAAQASVTPTGVKLRYPAKLCHIAASPTP
jgi:hypothetical protein